MSLESSYRRSRLAPRCRLITSWSWRWFQGFGCSPIKVVRELGLERCKTVRSLSTSGFKNFRQLTLVRKDREGLIDCLPVIFFKVQPGSFVRWA